jgi:hypothetical protein
MRQARTRTSPERSRFLPERALFIVAALVLVVGLQMPVATYLSPKNGIGYALGVVGGVMILAQSLYVLRKRIASLEFLGSVSMWLQWHLMLGIVAPVLILIHCGFSLGATNSNIALIAMLLVAGSGIFGRYLDSKIHRGSSRRRGTLAELQRDVQEIKERGSKLVTTTDLVDRIDAEESRLLAVGGWGGLGVVAAPFAIGARYAASHRLLCQYARSAIKIGAARHKAIATQRERFEHITFEYISRRLQATRKMVELQVYERLFSVWHALHVPLFLILIAAGIVHVVSVHLY